MFEQRIFTLKNQKWKTQQINTSDPKSKKIIDKVKRQARLKSKHTMNADQSGDDRRQDEKYLKQLMGSLSEEFTKIFLNKRIKLSGLANSWEVKRYDNIRTDSFKNSSGEWDLKISRRNSDEEYEIETRSSISHNIPFRQALKNYDIIGPYKSIVKKGEEIVSIYVRPMFEYINYNSGNDYEKEFENLFLNKKIVLHLVGGCFKKDMKNNNKRIFKNMGQGNTIYTCVPIIKGKDIENFTKTLTDTLKRKTNNRLI